MLKKIIDEAALETLETHLKPLYTKKDDGKYHLNVEDDDHAELKRAKEHEKERRKAAEDKLAALEAERKQAEDAKTKAQEEAAKKDGDFEALEKSWKTKMDQALADKDAQIAKAHSALQATLVDNVAFEVANEISTVPGLMADKIKRRLTVEITSEGKALTRVLDEQGQPSALSIADLKKEIVDNKDYSAIIKGSNASGGGASGGSNGGGASGHKALKDMTATEEAQFANQYPDEYNRMVGRAS